MGRMLPVKTSLPPAPEKLLKVIRYNCKTTCDTKKCTCRKYGLECSNASGDCKRISCSNSLRLKEVQEIDDINLKEKYD